MLSSGEMDSIDNVIKKAVVLLKDTYYILLNHTSDPRWWVVLYEVNESASDKGACVTGQLV